MTTTSATMPTESGSSTNTGWSSGLSKPPPSSNWGQPPPQSSAGTSWSTGLVSGQQGGTGWSSGGFGGQNNFGGAGVQPQPGSGSANPFAVSLCVMCRDVYA